MKYTILLLNYDPEHKMCDMIKNCLHSIVSHSIGHDYEIIVLDRKGLQKEINRGFKQARGQYVILTANDVMIENNWLDHFAVPGHITSFHASTSNWNPEKMTNELDFSCICFPKEVLEKVGEYDENFDGGYGYCDNDYLYRASMLGIPFLQVPVKVKHLMSKTFENYKDLGKDEKGMGKNHDYILRKHKLGNYRV